MGVSKRVKTTGAVWNVFYADKVAWPEGAFHDDTLLAINGHQEPECEIENLPVDALVEILSGYVVLPGGADVDLEEHFVRWQAGQIGTQVVAGVFRVEKSRLDAVRRAILDAGGELVD